MHALLATLDVIKVVAITTANRRTGSSTSGLRRPSSTSGGPLQIQTAPFYMYLRRLSSTSSTSCGPLQPQAALFKFRRPSSASSITVSSDYILEALLNKLVPWCVWLLSGALEIPRSRLRVTLATNQ